MDSVRVYSGSIGWWPKGHTCLASYFSELYLCVIFLENLRIGQITIPPGRLRHSLLGDRELDARRAPAERLPAAVANADIEPQLHRSTGTELVSGAGEVKKEEEKFEPGTGPLPGETEAEGAARTLAPKVHPQPKSDKGSEQSRKSEPSATATRRSTGGGEGVREARSRSPRRRETKEKKVSRSRSRRARSSGGRRRRNSRSESVPRARPTQGWVC